MSNTTWIGDFLGFSYNGIHSSTYNIVRVSNGNRFEKSLIPSSQDTTAMIPGNDGMYYFNSTFQPVIFNISAAYDNLTESNIRDIRTWLSSKKELDLIFDEEPYKVYKAKVMGEPKLSYVCFDDAQTNLRVYKGELSVQFQCYNPLARCLYKSLSEYSDTIYTTKHQWREASRMLNSRLTPKVYDRFVTNSCSLYNPGDKDSPITIYEFGVQNNTGYQSITYTINGTQVGRLIIDMSKLSVGAHYRIDSELKLILGFDYSGGLWKLNNKIYNGAIAAGDFISVKANQIADAHTLTLSPAPGNKINIVRQGDYDVDYNYFYY